nr:hypothetical protein [Tanacetum cinerariifolium]
MVLVDHTGWKLRRRQWTGIIEQLIESTYDNAPNMFSIRIHHGGKFLSYPGLMYVSVRDDIFDMVDIDLFTDVALNMMVLKLGYTEHGVTVLDSYLRAPRVRETLEDITDEPAGSIAANRTEKMLLLTWHEFSEATKESDCILTPPTDESVITYTQLSASSSRVIDDVMRQLSFDETEIDGEASFVDVLRSGVDNSGLSHDESFGEPDVGPTQEPILAEVSTQEPIMAEVSTQEPIVVEVGTEAPIVEENDESALTDGQFFYDDEGIDTAYETEYDVQSSEDAGTDDDDVDEDFFVDEENEIVEPDVDVHLFGEDVDVINADGFDSDPGNDEERNYRTGRLAELRTEMEGVINASGQWKRNLKLYKNDSVRIRARCEGKVPVFTMSQGTGPTGPYSGMEAKPSGSSGLTTKSKKGRI